MPEKKGLSYQREGDGHTREVRINSDAREKKDFHTREEGINSHAEEDGIAIPEKCE